jgi:hypothetical protein
LRADNADQRLVEIIIVKTAGPQEGAVRRAVETFDDNARAVFAFYTQGRPSAGPSLHSAPS